MTWSLDTKKKQIGTSCPLLGFRWSGGKTDCTLHYLAFRSLFSQQTPSGCQKKKKKILNRYLISSCAIWKQRVRFIFHFYRDRRSRRTVRAVSYSSRSETQARGEKSDILVTSSACLEQDLAPLPSPSVLFVKEMLLL